MNAKREQLGSWQITPALREQLRRRVGRCLKALRLSKFELERFYQDQPKASLNDNKAYRAVLKSLKDFGES